MSEQPISPNHHGDRFGEITVDIQHRCSRMREHIDDHGQMGTRGTLPVPCADCYSLAVSAVRIPYQPSTKRVTVTPEPRERQR